MNAVHRPFWPSITTARAFGMVFRQREEIRRGARPEKALITAMGRVGQSITFSAGTVIAALSCLLVASLLLAGLTLLPALLAAFGSAVFWPSRPTAGESTTGAWGRLAARVVARP